MTAADDIRGSAARGDTEMVAAFRALFLSSPTAPQAGGPWAGAELRSLGLLQVPETLIRLRDYETLFALARSERFLREQADEFPRSRPNWNCADPLRTLEEALRAALELDLVPEMAAFTLSRARWASTRAEFTPLAALRAGQEELAYKLADARPAGQQAVWYLLMAWERHDAGSADSARQVLIRLLPKQLPLLRARDGRRVVTLLRYAAQISPEAFVELQRRLLDDNYRVDLCRELTEVGELAVVPAVAEGIRLSAASRLAVSAQAAKAAMSAGLPEIAAAALTQATAALALLTSQPERTDPASLAEALALVAGAHAACGDLDAARPAFGQALEACRRARPADVAPAIRTIAAELAEARAFDDAEYVINMIADSHYEGQALEALAVARARAGQAAAAVRALDQIDPDLYVDYPHAAVEVARALAAAGRPELAGDVARRWLRPERHAEAIAAVASAVAGGGDVALAMTLADGITEPAGHARALAGICRRPGGGMQAAQAARRAVDALDDPGLRAGLLAELAAAGTGEDRGPLLEEAVRLAGTLCGEERWRSLLAVGLAQLTSDPGAAPGTFAEVRRIIRETEPDSDHQADELWKVAMTQAGAGDLAGARQTYAEFLDERPAYPGSLLKPATLAAIAIDQGEAGQREAALRACGLAIRHAAGLPRQWQAVTYHAITRAQAAAGDLDAAAETVATMLENADAAWEDDDAVTETAAEAIHAAVCVARELSRAGRPKKARHLLTDVAGMARDWLAGTMLGDAEAAAELACALAETGKDGKAAKVAEWDQTGAAADRLHAVIAGRLAADGDRDGGFAAARLIRDPRVFAQALVGIAATLSSRDEPGEARAVLAAGASELQTAEPAVTAVPALIEVAAAQAAAGGTDDIAATLEMAQLAAAGTDSDDDRDYALSLVAQRWALHDPGRALRLAADIGNEDRAGEAVVAAALALVAHERGEWPAAMAIIDSVRSPGWRAVGLAVIDEVKSEGSDAPRLSATVGELVSKLPEGAPRARAQRYIIEVALEAGDHETALQAARGVTASGGQVLSDLAGDLATRGAVNAVKSLLPDCASHPESAYAACRALARAVPSHADAIVTEVAAS